MSKPLSMRMFTLAQRELQESKNSLIWTPVALITCLVLIMLVSVLVANRITVVGDTVLQVLLEEQSAASVDVRIEVEGHGDAEDMSYTVEKRTRPENEKDWDFSRDWEFEPKRGSELQYEIQEELDQRVDNLNPVLHMVNNLLLFIMFMITVTYLLASLYSDRKDRSILFWRSLPVSEWDEVLSKFGMAMVVIPAIYLGASLIIQIAYVLIAMLLVWRLEMDPFELVLANIDFGPLLLNQLSGWLLTSLWIAPVYAWLLLASAAARRSPFMLALAPVITLVLVERIFLGSEMLASAVGSHLPHYEEGGASLGFYIYAPNWASQDFVGILIGLVFTAAALSATVYLRRYRFEL